MRLFLHYVSVKSKIQYQVKKTEKIATYKTGMKVYNNIRTRRQTKRTRSAEKIFFACYNNRCVGGMLFCRICFADAPR